MMKYNRSQSPIRQLNQCDKAFHSPQINPVVKEISLILKSKHRGKGK